MRSQATFTALTLVGSAAAFWRMPCRSQTGVGRLDPIMDAGSISGHVHSISGGGGFGFNADFDSLNAPGSCTSCEVTQDHSAYWTPTPYFMYDNGTAVMVPQVGGMLAYYLYYLQNVSAFPEGFQMVAGDPNIRNFTGPFPDTDLSSWPTDPTDQFFLQQRAIGFNCLNYAKTPEPSLYRHQLPSKEYMDANCADGLRFEMAFPSCGNGQPDSKNHKSHVAYPSLVKEGNCPKGYDTHYPFLFYETIWATNQFSGENGKFVLSMGDPVGTGYHGDFIMGWESADFLQKALDTCTNPSGQISDCPLFDIQSDAVGAKCTFDMPDALKDDDVFGPRDGLPVNIPVQDGPEPATAYAVAGRAGVSTSSLPSTTGTSSWAVPTLSYTPANPSLTSTALGGIVVDRPTGGNYGSIGPAGGKSEPAVPTSSSSSSDDGWSFSSSTEAPTTTAPAALSSSDGADIIATSYITTGNTIVELAIEQVEVTVTATPSAGVKHKRHMDKHRHAHRRR
ncbi:hypothetical protein LTR78_000302 [Recurvomyces mirabilis]|uniref:DUF1996 domain-containing protein n=1 Tax=Recurvomyces mirabilis TaxID=574656 RepID=A0AAE1C6C2_9PEZI|nr:hypothetical protein LTR78_000302 [Recurvomyces mirabilis]KAK5161957.1 hypothetical protein LTS14_000303 [Recurvomyces mirabilis]